ncbi:MAG: AraC family transcriptional regulator [Sedimentisphaerales bacterium]
MNETILPEYGIIVQSRTQRQTSHSHKNKSILYIANGRGVVEYESDRYDLQADSVIMLQAGRLHKLADKPKMQMTVFAIYFDIEKTGFNKNIIDYLFDSAGGCLTASEKPFILPIYYAEQVKKNLRQILYEQKFRPPGFKLSIQQNFSLAVLNIYRAKIEQAKQSIPPDSKDSLSRTMTVLDYIAENSHEQFSLRDAAKMAKLSERRFTSLCRKAAGKSYTQFLNFHRCNRAKHLIETTDMSIASIAFELGYEDISTFYRAFKAVIKCRPSELRSKNII